MGPAQWGDVPTWAAATFAGGAAWCAFLTIKSQRQQIGEQRAFIAEQSRFMSEQQQNLELERAEFRAQAEERRVSQARQVVMTFAPSGSSGEDRYGNGTGYDRWRVEVKNDGDDPISNVVVRFGEAYVAASATENEGFYHPDRGRRPVPVPLIQGGHTVVFESSRWPEATVDNNRPVLLFTDRVGVRWRRDSYGKLEEEAADAS
ncbi:hypothetical protein ACFWGL_17090 [Streptomyces sp. NPDC060286]|uniref:hypothetical protein n=1 Tax=unclassified Streptomyces TaxID=2593676 RepID=UPI0035E2FA75